MPAWEKSWELIDSEQVPGSEGIMRLMRRGSELAIRVDGRELMCNTVHGSEDALANLVADRLGRRPAPRMLIGGLGMGFTLAALLRRIDDAGRVVVAELVPAIVRWNRGVLGAVAGNPLDDPRASIHDGDVADLIRSPPEAWDAILLDVDNGPTGLTRPTNDWLYNWQGLDAAFSAVNPGGILAVWSAAPDDAFARRMDRAGFSVETIGVRSRGAQGGHRHVVWVGTRRTEAPPWHRS